MSLDAHTAGLLAVARTLHRRGALPATSGNLSVRLGPRTMLVTASGRDKGALVPDDLLVVDVDTQEVLGTAGAATSGRPSAETALHAALYRRDGACGAVVHTHDAGSTVLSMAADTAVVLDGYELAKALHGVTRHDVPVVVPVVDNDQDVPALADAVDRRLAADSVAYLIRGHGLYTWGPTLTDAARHVEALGFLFDCELRRRAR
ncbi:MAG: methylthioribulose 1-phosphate dehydratase [Alphaproteobacteria bacterium]|nr:methylthioribulose 1-phosphate dehydratase [Alphaproteobacteria bacterium]